MENKNYFEHFQMEPSFNVDLSALKKNFLKKSREYHPDFHSDASASAQAAMLELSSFNNTAFNTLKDEHLRFKYILELHGVDLSGGQQNIPQEFLMEMMDFNESLMDAKMEMDEKKLNDLKEELESVKKVESDKIAQIKSSYQFQTISPENLQSLIDFYLKSKYLQRLESQLSI